MKTVTRTRTVVIVGDRPRVTPTDVLGDVRPGEEAAVFVLGLDPSPQQRRFTEQALSMAADRRFMLTAELVAAPSRLVERLGDGDVVRVAARAREARRWRLEPGPVLSPGGA